MVTGRHKDLHPSVYVVMLVSFMLSFGGYLANIYKLVVSGFDPILTMTALRFIGVVLVPLGAFLGYVP